MTLTPSRTTGIAALGVPKDLERFARETVLIMDTETTQLRPVKGGLRLLQIASPETKDHLVLDAWEFTLDDWEYVRNFFNVCPRYYVFHNAKFDIGWLHTHGIYIHKPLCTRLASRLIWNGKPGLKHGLADLIERLTSKPIDKEMQRSDWSQRLTAEQIIYAALDVKCLAACYHQITELLIQGNIYHAWMEECKAVPAISQMERFGLRWDVQRAKTLKDEVKRQVEEHTTNFVASVEEYIPRIKIGKAGFTLNSYPQMHQLFALILGEIPVDPKTKKKSVQQKVLKEYMGKSEEVKHYCDMKVAEKRRQLVTSILKEMTEEGDVYANFWQLGAETGRMSSSNPNIQNVPRSELFRSLVIPREGFKFVVADFSQMELRLAAVEANDETMVRTFQAGEDLHTATAKAIYHTDNPTKEQRRIAKSANFGLLYGAGIEGLRNYAAGMGIRMEYEEASRIHKAFHRTYKGIHKWQRDEAHNAAMANIRKWPAITIRRTGLRRYLIPEMNKMTTRCNNKVQGAGAAVLKSTLAALWPLMHSDGEGVVRLVAVVHDEIVLEVREADAQRWADTLRQVMEEHEALWLMSDYGDVPPLAEAAIGDNWAEAK